MSETPTLSRIRVYPVKSLRGVDREIWELDDFGLRYDRRWMIVDPDGEAVTLRDHPDLAQIAVEMTADRIELSAPQRSMVSVPLEPEPAAAEPVKIWSDTVAARPASEDASRWLSEFLRTACHLVYMPDETVRPVDPDYDPGTHRVAFSDGFPLLLVGEESMEELNRRLSAPLGIERFRPNLIVKGTGEPHAEDHWRRIRIGHVEIHLVKPCARCVITTTHPESGARGKEPLRTLATYRRRGDDVLFGQNGIHMETGTLRVDDPVQVLETGPGPELDEPVPEGAAREEVAAATGAGEAEPTAAAQEPAAAEAAEAGEAEAGEAEAGEAEAGEAEAGEAEADEEAGESAPPVELRFSARPEPEEVNELFRTAGRVETAGDPDPDRIRRTLDASNVLSSAWRGDELVAVLRGWTDGARDGFISDVVVHPDLDSSSIAVELIRRTARAHPGIHWILRPAEHTETWGETLGWKPLGEGWWVSSE